MKVLLINRHDIMDGGADRVFHNTYELLKEAGEDIQVEKFTRADAGMDSTIDPRSLSFFGKVRMVKDYLFNVQAAKHLEKKIAEFKPDVAHLHLIFGVLTISVLRVLNKHNIPVVMTLHDYRLICPANAFIDRNGKVCEKCRKTKYYNCLIKRCSGGNLFFSTIIMLEAYMRRYIYYPLKMADHFIFVSEFGRQKYIEYDQRYEKKSTRLYNMNVPVKAAPIHKGGYFLFYGRLSREKGILTLISAARMAGVRVIIAGSGPQESEIVEVLNQDQRNHNISFVGFKSGKELYNLIAGCSFVAVPSECYDNNPMCVVESFSMGKPVIGSRIGSIPESVTPENGFLFETGNAESLAGQLNHAENISLDEYTKMSVSCREYGEKTFDRKLHFDGLVGIFKQLVDQK